MNRQQSTGRHCIPKWPRWSALTVTRRTTTHMSLGAPPRKPVCQHGRRRCGESAARWDVVDAQAEGSVGLLNREQLDGARRGTAGGTDGERDRRRALVARKVGNHVHVVVAERE